MKLLKRSLDPPTDRHLISVYATKLDIDFKKLRLPSKKFILLLACDKRKFHDEAILSLGRAALKAGAVYVCAWGRGCERVHDLVDRAREEISPNPNQRTIIMTTFHKNERLEEAIWFARYVDWPADSYETTCNTVLFLSILNKKWYERVNVRITRYFLRTLK